MTSDRFVREGLLVDRDVQTFRGFDTKTQKRVLIHRFPLKGRELGIHSRLHSLRSSPSAAGLILEVRDDSAVTADTGDFDDLQSWLDRRLGLITSRGTSSQDSPSMMIQSVLANAPARAPAGDLGGRLPDVRDGGQDVQKLMTPGPGATEMLGSKAAAKEEPQQFRSKPEPDQWAEQIERPNQRQVGAHPKGVSNGSGPDTNQPLAATAAAAENPNLAAIREAALSRERDMWRTFAMIAGAAAILQIVVIGIALLLFIGRGH